MEIKVLGTGCAGCKALYATVEQVVKDFVITVCGSANETCPAFEGNVGKRLHIGFDDPSEVIGTTDFIRSEFERVRNEIKNEFAKFYITEIKKQELPKCACNR